MTRASRRVDLAARPSLATVSGIGAGDGRAMGTRVASGDRPVTLPVPYYSDDAVTIYHGDCRELLPLMPKVDLVLTDPPYGVGWNTDPSRSRNGPGFPPIIGDRQRFDPEPLLRLGVPTVLFGANYYADRLPPSP